LFGNQKNKGFFLLNPNVFYKAGLGFNKPVSEKEFQAHVVPSGWHVCQLGQHTVPALHCCAGRQQVLFMHAFGSLQQVKVPP